VVSARSWGLRSAFLHDALLTNHLGMPKDWHSSSPCRRLVPATTRSTPSEGCTIVAATGVAPMRLNHGGALLDFADSWSFSSLLLTYSQPWNQSLFVHKYCFCRSSPCALLGLLYDDWKVDSLLSIAGTDIAIYNTGSDRQVML